MGVGNRPRETLSNSFMNDSFPDSNGLLHHVDPVRVILVARLRLLGGMADVDDIERYFMLRQLQQASESFLRYLMRMDAAPDCPQPQIHSTEKDVLCGSAAVLYPELRKLHGQRALHIAAHHNGHGRNDPREMGSRPQAQQLIGIGDNIKLPGCFIARAGTTHGRMKQFCDCLAVHGLFGELAYTSPPEQGLP